MRAGSAIIVGLALACTCAAGGAGQSKLKDLIVGKWQFAVEEGGIEARGHISFHKDGTASMMIDVGGNSISRDAKYRVLDERTFELEHDEGGKTRTEKTTVVSINQQKMVIRAKDNKQLELVRVKALDKQK